MVIEPAAPGRTQHMVFHDTRWTVVRAAAGRLNPDGTNDPAAQAAFAQLCRTYWSPLYACLRSRGVPRHDAQDLTQGFFVHLLDGRLVHQADGRRGRFRSFLLTAFENFVRDERDRARSQRRGGQYQFVSLWEVDQAEARFDSDRAVAASWVAPEQFYEFQWASALVDAALDRLRADLLHRDRESLFERLRPFLVGGEELPADPEAAAALGLSPSALRTAFHRMRRQYGQLLREEVARTVASPQDVDTELRHLCAVLARQPAG